MMLRPSLYDIINEDQCYYSFVIAVAKRAREIVDEYNAEKEILSEKSVNLAVNQFALGNYTIVEDQDV